MEKIIGYTIESHSNEGVYYLVNGWNKYFSFWFCGEDVAIKKRRYLPAITFKTAGSAKASLTKLLKIMNEYKTDRFYLCEITDGGNINNIQLIKI